MDRRDFLRTTSYLAGSGLLAACGGDGSTGAAAIPVDEDAQQTMFVQQASFETIAGDDRWVSFGLRDLQNQELADLDVDLYVRTVPAAPEEEPQVVAGPIEASYAPAGDTGLGVYYAQADLPESGIYELVAVAGEEWGTAAIQVRSADESQLPAPGEEAISAQTPTFDDDLGFEILCTVQPEPCSMHTISLDQALEEGRRTVVLFATPQFCQTAVCGPSVETLDGLTGDFPDLTFVHSEIFTEVPEDIATAPLTPAVEAWGLPTEPWLFTIGEDGVILDRLDGPMPRPVIRSLLENLQAA